MNIDEARRKAIAGQAVKSQAALDRLAAQLREKRITAEAQLRVETMVIHAKATVVQPSHGSLVFSRVGELRKEGLMAVPPAWSSFLLACVASKGRADEFLGDAETEYRQMIAKLGAEQARWWYRVYVTKLACRMLPGAIMRVLLLHKVISLLGL